jgi:hypothetical protein
VVHQYEAKILYNFLNILTPTQFDLVDWDVISPTLHKVPKLFQHFAGKQVFDVSAVFKNLSHQKKYANLTQQCPCCSISIKDCAHILLCQEEGR